MNSDHSKALLQDKDYSSEINKAAGSDVEWKVIKYKDYFIIIPYTNLCTVDDYFTHNEEKQSWFVVNKNYVVANCHTSNHTCQILHSDCRSGEFVSNERVVTGPISERIREIFYSDASKLHNLTQECEMSEHDTTNILLIKTPNENYYLLYEYENGVSINELNKYVLINILSSSGMFFTPNFSKYSRIPNIHFIGVYEFTEDKSLKLASNATYLEGPIMYFTKEKTSNNSNTNKSLGNSVSEYTCVMKTSYKGCHIIYEYKKFITNEELIDCVLRDMFEGHIGFYFNPSGCDDLIKYKMISGNIVGKTRLF